MSLGNCIKTIDDERVKMLAERAAWLGNDETHYVRLWPEHDRKSLKTVIDLVVYWIDAQIRTEVILTDMPKGN